MLVLTIRTDKPQAEIGLYNSSEKLDVQTWQAHRELSVTIHQKIAELLDAHSFDLKDLDAILCFKGPGSFTGLRIGLTVGNALALSLSKPIVSTSGEDWIEKGMQRLEKGENEAVAMPEYGADAHITIQRK